MANPDHLKWLLDDGVKAWNNRRSCNKFKPDFRNADFSGRDLSSADLRKANLTDARLIGANLRETDLRGANLLRSEPWKAYLYADRSKTQDDIKEEISSISCLLRICQKLKKKYDSSQLGSFRFYFRGESQFGWELSPSIVRPVTSKPNGPQAEERNPVSLRPSEGEMLLDLMSRQPETYHDLKSTLAEWVVAQHHGLKTRLLDITRNPLVALFNACEEKDTCKNKDTKDGRLYIFAVPKKLIRPYSSDAISVVANFAKLRYEEKESILGKIEIVDPDDPEKCYKAKCCIYRKARGRLHHFICQEKPYFQDRIDPRDLFRVFVVEPQQLFERIRAQAGAFLISAFHSRFEREEILKHCTIPIYDYYKLSVRSNNKPDIIKDLRLLNVTRETLYPGLDEAAKAVTTLHTNYARR